MTSAPIPLSAERATRALLAGHEVRTPLHRLLRVLEQLGTGDDPLTARQRDLVQAARDEGGALLQLLDDAVDRSGAAATAVRAPFRADDVAADVVAGLRPLAEGRGLGLRLDAGAPALLLGDESRLRQVVMDLVGDALGSTERGEVALSVTTSRGAAGPDAPVRLTVAVTDTRAATGAEEGEREGLLLSRQVVAAMGGTLRVAGRPGVGCTVEVEVPLREAPAVAPVAVAAPVVEAAPARPVRVLVADDSDVNLLIASAMLTAQGADVVTVADGRQAVSAVQDGEFDLVLLDIRMPVMSGVDAAQAIRQLPGWRGSSRIVALTASADDGERRGFLEAGMDAVLVKPVTTDDLRRTLAMTTGGRAG